MYKIKLPATSANIGPGFDSFGIAFNLFNTFYVEKSDKLIIEGTLPEYSNENNLFYKAYIKALNKKKGLYVKFDTKIPFSIGLGSSATLILGGIIAANLLHELNLSNEEIFRLATEMEGHPDNIAPCLFGGFTVSFTEDNIPYKTNLKIHNSFKFTIAYPDFTTSTQKAREVLKKEVSLNDATYNLSHATSLAIALNQGNKDYISLTCKDKLHERYRSKLIKDYETIKKQALEKGALAFTISGSGPCCLIISTDPNFSKRLSLNSSWTIKDVKVSYKTNNHKEVVCKTI